MTNSEIELFKSIYLHLHKSNPNRVLQILEWGSGISTLYFTNFLLQHQILFEWNAIENNPVWQQKLSRRLHKKGLAHITKVHLFQFLPFWKRFSSSVFAAAGFAYPALSEAEMNYINFPKSLGREFDLILIDGRFRRRCLKVAAEVMSANGVVMLHDAQRVRYHCGFSALRIGKFYDGGRLIPFARGTESQFWVGTMEQNPLDVIDQEFAIGSSAV